jgi:hypothetical protein
MVSPHVPGRAVGRSHAGRQGDDHSARSVAERPDDVRRAGQLVHRLGQPLLVDGDLNIAPELPYDCGDIVGDPHPWLDGASFVCCGDESDIEWMLDWMALVVGNFSVKPGWHLLIKGKQGTGKNLMMLPLVSYLKAHHQADVTPKVLTGEFTTFLEKRLCCIDEMKTTTRGSSTGHDVYKRGPWRRPRMIGVS